MLCIRTFELLPYEIIPANIKAYYDLKTQTCEAGFGYTRSAMAVKKESQENNVHSNESKNYEYLTRFQVREPNTKIGIVSLSTIWQLRWWLAVNTEGH